MLILSGDEREKELYEGASCYDNGLDEEEEEEEEEDDDDDGTAE